MSGKSGVIGFVGSLAIAAGGGFLLGPLGASGRSEAAVTEQPPPFHTPARVLVEEVNGQVETLAPGGMWRRVVSGETLERPTALRTNGPDSNVTVSYDTARLSAQQDARVLLGGAGALAVQLDAGRVLIHSRAGQVSVSAPMHQAKVSGEAFGVWSRGDILAAAVLDGSVSIEDAGGIATQYTKGREILLLPKGPTPVVMVPELRLEVQNVEKTGKGFRISGQTQPSAVVMVKNGSRFESVAVSSNGNFTATLDSAAPKNGELVAYDAAGRRAELNKPSQTLDEVLASLSKGAQIANAAGVAANAGLPGGQVAQPATTAPAGSEKPGSEKKAAAEKKAVEALAAEKPAKVAAPVAAREPKKKKAKVVDTARAGGHGEPTSVGIDLPALPGEPAAVVEKKDEPKKDEAKPADKKEKKDGEEDAVELEWE